MNITRTAHCLCISYNTQLIYFTHSSFLTNIYFINPFTDEQQNLLGIMPKQVCHFSSLFIYCFGCKMISREAARGLIVLHPKQNIESELESELTGKLVRFCGA